MVLSRYKKYVRKPIIMKRDYGLTGNVELYNNHDVFCYLCGQRFLHKQGYEINYEHLNDDTGNDHVTNICLCHGKCNKEKEYGAEFKDIAKKKLASNIAWQADYEKAQGVLSQREGERIEDRINRKSHFIAVTTRKLLIEYLLPHNGHPAMHDKYPLADLEDDIAYEVDQVFGSGSQIAAHRHILKACSNRAKSFSITNIDGTNYVVPFRGA